MLVQFAIHVTESDNVIVLLLCSMFFFFSPFPYRLSIIYAKFDEAARSGNMAINEPNGMYNL